MLGGGIIIKGGSSPFGCICFENELSLGKDTLSVARRVSIGGNLSAGFPVRYVGLVFLTR